MSAFNKWLGDQDIDKMEDIDAWSAKAGWEAAMKYAANYLHEVTMDLRYGPQSDDERAQFASRQIQRCRDVISKA